MAAQTSQLHGQESVQYRKLPKVLGKCLDFMKKNAKMNELNFDKEKEHITTGLKVGIQRNDWTCFDSDMTVNTCAAIMLNFLQSLQADSSVEKIYVQAIESWWTEINELMPGDEKEIVKNELSRILPNSQFWFCVIS